MADDVATGEVVELCDLDGSACADALASSQSALVDAERLQMELVAQWCDLHSGPGRGPGRRAARTGVPAGDRVLPGQERSRVIGGDGTPAVGEFAAGELGLLLGTTTGGAQRLMRDVLGLRHRHPRLYGLVCAGHARFFEARHVARATLAAGLSLKQARQVDDRVAPFLGQVSWGRIIGLVEAAVIEVDPEAAEQRRVAAEMARFVRTGRSSEFGTMTIYAKARAGDAVFFLAMCDRIAQILRLRRSLEVAGHTDRCTQGPTGPDAEVEMDVLRSEAIGILASPVRAVALLQWAERHTTDGTDATDATDATDSPMPEMGRETEAGAAPAAPAAGAAGAADAVESSGADTSRWTVPVVDSPKGGAAAGFQDPQAALEPPEGEQAPEFPGCEAGPEPAGPEARGWQPEQWQPERWQPGPEPPEWEPEPEHACPPPVVLDASVDPDRYRPKALLYVHMSQESFQGRTRGAARIEGVGPVTIEQAVDFLRTCQVTVRPVIDLNANPSVDGYEVSPLLRETVVLRDPVETFPHGTLPSRHVDADHIRPYQLGRGSTGTATPQTNADNLQPLGRLHHRLKTLGGWSCTSPERGVVLWRSPHGHWSRVDTTGTTYIGRLEGAPVLAQIIDAHQALLASHPSG